MIEILLSTVGCGLLCYALGRYNRALTLQRWQFVLGLHARRAVGLLREKMELDAILARQALEAAVHAREAGRLAEAVAVLRAALAILEEAGADRLTRLRAMRVYSRMVRAIEPLPPPSAEPFRGAGLRALGSLAGLVHRFLVGSGERFRLWLLMLGLGVRIVLQGARRSATAAIRSPRPAGPWLRLQEGVQDFETLDNAHLAAFAALAASLAAVDRGGRLPAWNSIVNP